MTATGPELFPRPLSAAIQLRVAVSRNDGHPGDILAAIVVRVPPDRFRPEWAHYHGPVADDGRRARLETELRDLIGQWLAAPPPPERGPER